MDKSCPTPSKQPVVGIENSDLSGTPDWETVLHFALQICRKHGLIKDRLTLLSPSDFLQIVQLCQAQVHKKMGKGFEAEDSGVFTLARSLYTRKHNRAMAEVHNLLSKASHNDSGDDNAVQANSRENALSDTPSKPKQQGKGEAEAEVDSLTAAVVEEYNNFLASSNHVDTVDVMQTFLLELLKPDSELLSDLPSFSVNSVGCPTDSLQELILRQLTQRRAGVEGGVDPPARQGCLTVCMKSKVVKATALWPGLYTPEKADPEFSPGSEQVTKSDMTEEVVRELFQSYLQLLVNTRSELALAHIFNSPDRGLTHHAFTHLKHLAHTKHMTLYQTAMSVMLQLRLGGSGYAPTPDNHLLQYVKGLGLLFDLMNKLQQLLEDTQCVRSSVARVVGVIRKNLIGCKSQRYKREMVERVGSEIQRDLQCVLEQLEGDNLLISPDKPACQGGSLTSRRPRRVLLHYLDQYAASLWGASLHPHHTWLHDVSFGPHTPSRFPCVLSQFRSPALGSVASPASNKGQKKEVAQRKRKMTVSTNLMPDDSDQPLIQRCSKRLCDTVIVLPSKTIVHPAESRSPVADQKRDIQGKENLQAADNLPSKKAGKTASGSRPPASSDAPLRLAAKKNGETKESGETKGLCQASSQQPSGKRVPKTGKKCRRRLLSPLKGQQSITSFFRV